MPRQNAPAQEAPKLKRQGEAVPRLALNSVLDSQNLLSQFSESAQLQNKSARSYSQQKDRMQVPPILFPSSCRSAAKKRFHFSRSFFKQITGKQSECAAQQKCSVIKNLILKVQQKCLHPDILGPEPEQNTYQDRRIFQV